MKKSLLALAALAALSLVFVSCGGGGADPSPDNPKSPVIEEPTEGEEQPAGETVIATGKAGTFFKWADYGITTENASDYIVRVTYTLDDTSKAGWGPGAFNDKDWANNSLGDALNVTAAGVNEISVSDVIAVEALSEGFLINWWGTYATLVKVEIIKK